MNVSTENLASIDEAEQDFSRIAHMVDEKGPVVILENNSPRYLLIGLHEAEQEQIASAEEVLSISKRLIDNSREAYGALAE